jgi:predicted amino acid racemase
MKDAGIDTSFMLLRLPPLSRADETVTEVDVSLNSEPAVLDALSAAAEARGLVHDVFLMVELGDLREGIRPADLAPVVKHAARLPAIRIAGLGANLACLAGVVPGERNMQHLATLADEAERLTGTSLEWVSGINSSGLDLIAAGRMPPRINHARIGEAILLGRETTQRRPWPGTCQDAFRLYAEVLELKKKPSAPTGERGEDAFGRYPVFEDRGERRRALVNLGHEDVDVEGLRPLDRRFRIVGASSGYLVLDIAEGEGTLSVGDELAFDLNYSALLAVMSSEYVEKRLLGQGGPSTSDIRIGPAE